MSLGGGCLDTGGVCPGSDVGDNASTNNNSRAFFLLLEVEVREKGLYQGVSAPLCGGGAADGSSARSPSENNAFVSSGNILIDNQ